CKRKKINFYKYKYKYTVSSGGYTMSTSQWICY
ncbi:unnamed protein product, partial [marine sediment metagenome]